VSDGKGGTGNTTLVIDITDAGQHSIPAGRHIVWTEYPDTPVSVLDTNLTDAALAQIYWELGDVAGLTTQVEELESAVAALSTGGALIQSAKGTTDANGAVTFTWGTAFSAPPVVVLAVETSTAEAHSTRITSCTASAVSVHVARSPVVSILSVNVTAAMVNASGVTVHAVAVGTP